AGGGSVSQQLGHLVAAEKASATRVVTPASTLGCGREIKVESVADATACRYRAAIAPEAPVAPFQVTLQRSSGLASDHVHHPAHGARAVQRGGRPLEDLHPLHVGEVERG